MSKQQSTVKSTPKLYQGLPASRPSICIMEDMNGNFSLHNSKESLEKLQSFSTLIKDTIQRIWPEFNTFLKENKQTILTYHANLFNAEPPKDQPIEITADYCWRQIILTAKTDMTTQVPVIAGRKSTIGNCQYTTGPTPFEKNCLKTPQSIECLKLFTECYNKISGNRKYVTEAELRKYIKDNGERLHTRQDPWRIFQYYRPELIKQNLIHRK